jgi:hydroxyacylglutathione hydrolase
MKFSVKRFFISLGIALGIVIILFAGTVGFYMYKFHNEVVKMSAINTVEIIPGITAIKDVSFVNFYLIKGKDCFIAIDAGADIKASKKEFAKLNIDPAKISACFFTHTDYDHIADIDLFKNAKLYISKDEEQMVDGRTAKFLFFKNKINAKFNLFDDGNEFEIDGVKIKCVLTPGHTPGSTSFIVNGKYLFTGDTISLKNGKAEAFNEFFNMDTKKELKSIKILSELTGIEYVFTAHYGYTSDFKKAFEK